ncbi:MAG: hypothetical protein Q8R83_08135 [Legionellaceae bacterium]|nr:hypothetical protein [Legionellaceae bacterium]
MLDEGVNQKPPAVSQIKLISRPLSDVLSFAESTGLTVSRTGQQISYWSSGYNTAIFEADMEIIQERRMYFDYSSIVGEGGSGPGGNYWL